MADGAGGSAAEQQNGCCPSDPSVAPFCTECKSLLFQRVNRAGKSTRTQGNSTEKRGESEHKVPGFWVVVGMWLSIV